MASNYLSLRMNKDLKDDFYGFCKSKGFTAGRALKYFSHQFVKAKKLPFSIDEETKYPEDNFVRCTIYLDHATKQAFSDACDEYGLPMSIVVRAYMNYCVVNNAFPEI